MIKYIRKSTTTINYSTPKIIKGKVIYIGQPYKPKEFTPYRLELIIQCKTNTDFRNINAVRYGRYNHCLDIYKEVKLGDTVICIGQPTVNNSFYFNKQYFTLDYCAKEESFKRLVNSIREGNCFKFLGQSWKLLIGDRTYQEVLETYFSHN